MGSIVAIAAVRPTRREDATAPGGDDGGFGGCLNSGSLRVNSRWPRVGKSSGIIKLVSWPSRRMWTRISRVTPHASASTPARLEREPIGWLPMLRPPESQPQPRTPRTRPRHTPAPHAFLPHHLPPPAPLSASSVSSPTTHPSKPTEASPSISPDSS